MATPMRAAQRVFAVASADDTTVRLYGIGTYVGDHPRPGSGPPWSEPDVAMVRSVLGDDTTDEKVNDLLAHMSLNPKIELDSGEVVWGCECWWGDLSRYDEMVGGREVVNVSITADREAAAIAEGRNFAPFDTNTEVSNG